jgi:TP901 family phage tail tape measure protein
MGENESVYRKLILVTADTSGLVNLQGDVNKANQVLQQMGLNAEQAIKVVDKGTTITNNFGKVTTSSMSQIETASGKTFNVMVKGGKQGSEAMMMIEKAMMRVLIVVPLWMLMRNVMMGFLSSIQEGAKFLIEFESAMAQIRIVGKGTEEDYKRLGNTILAFSSNYGIAATEALKAAKIFSQQGLTINQVIDMTRTSMIASAVLGKDVASVAEDLTSAVRAYNTPMEDSLSIVDKWMAVQKNFAVTASDLADATKKAGATASSFGISYNKLLGDTTAIIEVTRKTGGEAGNALQMMYTRLFTTGAKAVQEIAKVPIYQDRAGKATYQNTNIFRSASDVIDDMASSWNKLSESEKIEMAVSIGSRRQATPFIALMNNYNRSLEAQVVALTSAGDALTSFNILQDTTKVKITQMQNTWAIFATTLGDTSSFKFVIDSVKNLAEGLIFLANATDYVALKLRQQNQAQIDATSVDISRLKSIKDLNELETKLLANPTEKNKILLSKVQTTRESILASNPELANMDVKSAQYKIIKLEVERDRAIEIATLQKAQDVDKMSIGGALSVLSPIGGSNARASFKAYEELIKKYGSLAKAKQAIDKGIEDEIKSRMAQSNVLTLLGEADEAKIQQGLEEDLRKYKEIEEEVKFIASIMKDRGYSEQQILEWEIKQYETNGKLEKSIDAQNKKRQLSYELIKSINDEIKAQSDVLEKSISDTILSWEKGAISIKQGFQNIGDTIRNSFMSSISEGLSTNIINSSGIGQMFGGLNVNLKSMLSGQGGISGGIENGAYKGTYNGVKDALAISGVNKAVWSGGRGSSANGWTMPGFGAQGFFTQPMSGEYQYLNAAKGGNYQSGYGKVVNGKWVPYTGVNKGQVYGGIAASALTGYSAYQSSGGGMGAGIATGVGSLALMGASMGFAGAAATGGAAAGALVAMPWLLPVLGVALLMGASMFGGKKQTSTQVSTQENAISSKIQISNKQLELVNRNLVAMRTDIRTYILPQSAAFSMKSGNIEDEYSVLSRSGYKG